MVKRVLEFVIGKPKDPLDPKVFHNISLVAFFAWVGLGADGLSSSCYGPEEAFLALGSHKHMAILLAIAVSATVFILSASYSQIIEEFPSGGGGYLVATKLLGPLSGLVSGCALLVDYMLTIAISVASSMDAIFSFLPHTLHAWKFAATLIALVGLITLNLRGVKESIKVLMPIFIIFVVTHTIGILYGVFTHGSELPRLVTDTVVETRDGISNLGFIAMAVIFLRAFCLGGGTFTGIEAVSNGMSILREPRVATGKKTMAYMAISLAFTAGGILISYILNNVSHLPGQTLNASLFHSLTDHWPGGRAFFLITMLSEGALLLVAAQAGFLGGPPVMSTMALDRWLPGRLRNLSDRLVIKDGVLVLGLTAMAMIFYTHASVRILVVMYSINVFLTFTFSQLGMVRHWVRQKQHPHRIRKLLVNGTGLLLSAGIMVVMVILKFGQGGWVTLAITGVLIAFCLWVHKHYNDTNKALKHLDEILTQLPLPEQYEAPTKKLDEPTALLMVNGYNGMGIHSILAIHRFFPGHFKNFVFLSVGVIDSDRFKGTAELENLKQSVNQDLEKYVVLSNKMGIYAEHRYTLETDVIEGLETLCDRVSQEWDRKVFFMGQLAFEGETFWTRLLHNQTSFALQRKLLFLGHEAVILPIRVRLPA